MKSITAMLASPLLMMSAGAAAQSAPDVKCLILSNIFAKATKEAKSQKAAEASLYFYLGRVTSTASPAQLKAALEAQSRTIDDKTAGEQMNGCVSAIQMKMQMVQNLAPSPPKNP